MDISWNSVASISLLFGQQIKTQPPKQSPKPKTRRHSVQLREERTKLKRYQKTNLSDDSIAQSSFDTLTDMKPTVNETKSIHTALLTQKIISLTPKQCRNKASVALGPLNELECLSGIKNKFYFPMVSPYSTKSESKMDSVTEDEKEENIAQRETPLSTSSLPVVNDDLNRVIHKMNHVRSTPQMPLISSEPAMLSENKPIKIIEVSTTPLADKDAELPSTTADMMDDNDSMDLPKYEEIVKSYSDGDVHSDMGETMLLSDMSAGIGMHCMDAMYPINGDTAILLQELSTIDSDEYPSPMKCSTITDDKGSNYWTKRYNEMNQTDTADKKEEKQNKSKLHRFKTVANVSENTRKTENEKSENIKAPQLTFQSHTSAVMDIGTVGFVYSPAKKQTSTSKPIDIFASDIFYIGSDDEYHSDEGIETYIDCVESEFFKNRCIDIESDMMDLLAIESENESVGSDAVHIHALLSMFNLVESTDGNVYHFFEKTLAIRYAYECVDLLPSIITNPRLELPIGPLSKINRMAKHVSTQVKKGVWNGQYSQEWIAVENNAIYEIWQPKSISTDRSGDFEGNVSEFGRRIDMSGLQTTVTNSITIDELEKQEIELRMFVHELPEKHSKESSIFTFGIRTNGQTLEITDRCTVWLNESLKCSMFLGHFMESGSIVIISMRVNVTENENENQPTKTLCIGLSHKPRHCSSSNLNKEFEICLQPFTEFETAEILINQYAGNGTYFIVSNQ